jgi:hypothetical protein
MKLTLVVAGLLLAGCAPQQSQAVYTADGRQGHSLNCTYDTEMKSGTFSGNWGLCFQKAGELCGSAGYDVMEKSDDHAQYSSFNMYGGSSGTINQRTMVIACRGAKR